MKLNKGKQMTKEKMLKKIESLVTKAKREHLKREKEREVHALKDKRTFKPHGFYNTLPGYGCMKWMSRKQVFGLKNVTFNPFTMVADSYDWWVFVLPIKGKIVFNNYNYSMTTCKHQGEVRQLLKSLGIKIDLEVSMHSSLSENNFKVESLSSFYTELFQLEIALNRKNTKKSLVKDRNKQCQELLKSIKTARKLGAVFTRQQMKDLKQSLLDKEVERLADMAKENVRRAELRKQAKMALDNSLNSVEVKQTQLVELESELALNNSFGN